MRKELNSTGGTLGVRYAIGCGDRVGVRMRVLRRGRGGGGERRQGNKCVRFGWHFWEEGASGGKGAWYTDLREMWLGLWRGCGKVVADPRTQHQNKGRCRQLTTMSQLES